ncbi:MAG: hypothetical protein GXP63_04065 [DPANN group archaeon]|nr:hypothetical protein [DPANN group archaeon]
MQHLKRINDHYYRILGEPSSHVHRYIFTSPETRAICNQPEVLGCEYTDNMSRAMVKALKLLPNGTTPWKEKETCVLNFLRGGLNFDLRKAIRQAWGFNTHATSFMSSQRFRKDGRWGVTENQYRKFIFPKDAVMFIGDVVATGVTIEEGMKVILDAMEKNGSSLKRLYFFTFGCHKVEKVLDDLHVACKERFKNFDHITVIYLEGKFRLADSKTTLRISIPGTDLLRTDALVAPEFALSQYDALSHALERCIIYDAGSRSFDIPEYSQDVIGYWEQVRKLAEQGFTLHDALMERWPEKAVPFEAFASLKREAWPDIEESLLKRLYGRSQERLELMEASNSADALVGLCDRQIAKMDDISSGEGTGTA